MSDDRPDRSGEADVSDSECLRVIVGPDYLPVPVDSMTLEQAREACHVLAEEAVLMRRNLQSTHILLTDSLRRRMAEEELRLRVGQLRSMNDLLERRNTHLATLLQQEIDEAGIRSAVRAARQLRRGLLVGAMLMAITLLSLFGLSIH
jgi:hypothetical protein